MEFTGSIIVLKLLYLLKHVLAYAADRAAPVIRQIFKGSPGSDSTVRVTLFKNIHVTAGAALIFCCFCSSAVLSRIHFCLRFSDQAFHQCGNTCQIFLFRIPLGSDILIDHIKPGTGKLLLQDFDRLAAPAIASEGRCFLIIGTSLF